MRKIVCRAPDWRGTTNPNADWTRQRSSRQVRCRDSARNTVAGWCKGVRGLEGGLWHRSIGTLVTSAEPRAERNTNLSAFVRLEERNKFAEKNMIKIKRKKKQEWMTVVTWEKHRSALRYDKEVIFQESIISARFIFMSHI